MPWRRGSCAIADPPLVGGVEDSSRQLPRRVIDQRGALRYNWRVADEDANSVRNDIVQDDTRFDEVIHRFTKVSLEVALKTGEGRSTSPGGATCWRWSKHDVAASLNRCLTDGLGHAQEVGAP